ncbi:FecCD family ABC transporter permease [Dethiobacter alkaliphilus]|uniref:FecCD family ABC transporter permease n=1 Tax=Dethiobacter alkaliphilus TaxID=427926 RepID=UPI0022270657|nr:iron chelate uptake ABC transporter family permease subunit [Dethiobacter alkaliphilus]MCW3490462.1 iron chelate uptake ABC transporter family permease subunit [Dethiobacter alkaliphilus]
MSFIAIVAGAASIPLSSAVSILLSPSQIYYAVVKGDVADIQHGILLLMRLPRVIQAAIVGASLAVAGAVLQGLFRNPMADPYVLGVSSGAALGAVIAMLTGGSLLLAGFTAVPLFAFIGGISTIALVYYMSRVGKAVPVMTLLLAGIAVSAFLSAFVSLLTYFAGERLHQVIFWMMGGFGGATWSRVFTMLPYILVGFTCIYYYARELNVFLLGEETARHLGVDTEKVKKILLASSSLLVAAAVSTSGIIGFVGLVVPHFIRIIVGPDHRILLPASALLGANLLIATDTLARTIIAPAELPVGIITAMVGAPMFIYLLKKRKKLRYFNTSS